MPGKKDNIAPGIDRYGDEVVFIYNPHRPVYWLPVTIREVFESLINYWRLYPDKIASDMTVKMLEDEYALYSESERDGFAYLGGRGPAPLSGERNDSTNVPVMKANPEYWNKNLPHSAVQVIAFKCPAGKKIIEQEMEEKLKNNSGTYHISRFLRELDITSLLPVIDK